MSEVIKTKLKIGDHEFEAEGPAEVVQAQFAAFRELVAAAGAAPKPVQPTRRDDNEDTPPPPPRTNGGELALDLITKVEGRVVSLTVRRETLDDEVMLVLLGQKMLRNNDSVTGGEVLDGLRLTGRTINRADYQLDKLTTAGDVITIGQGRARRYRLTNQGVTRARELARATIATVA